MEFLKGETDPVGDCGNFAAGIDVHGADQFPHDSKKRTWYSRVECYGNTAEHADELRDKVLALLVTTEHDGELHKAVFMALESYGGADTFRDGVMALAQQSKERGADLDRVTAERDAALAELAKQDRVLRSSVPEEHKACTSPVGAVQNYIGDLEQGLTAADERADVLEGLSRDSRDVMSGIWDTSYDHDAGDALAALDLMERIDAALKPAEGGGAHAKHYECIGKGGDYTIVAIAQGAGTLKGFNHYVYKNKDGVHFVRDPEDFLSRMQVKP